MEDNKKDINSFIWRNAQGERKMMVLSEQQLQKAYNRVCVSEFDAFHRQTTFTGLRDQIEAVAEAKGITLKYPDEEVVPKRVFGRYFEHHRRLKRQNKIIDKFRENEGKVVVGTGTGKTLVIPAPLE